MISNIKEQVQYLTHENQIQNKEHFFSELCNYKKDILCSRSYGAVSFVC